MIIKAEAINSTNFIVTLFPLSVVVDSLTIEDEDFSDVCGSVEGSVIEVDVSVCVTVLWLLDQ